MIFAVESLIYIVYKIIFATPSIQKIVGSDHSPARGATQRFVRAEGVRFLGLPTSNCSHFMTTGSYPHKFHSRDNDDSYLTNLSQIFKIHVDFRVISETTQLETSNISKCPEFSAERE